MHRRLKAWALFSKQSIHSPHANHLLCGALTFWATLHLPFWKPGPGTCTPGNCTTRMVTVPQSLLKLTKLAKPKATHSASPDPFQGDHNKAFVLRLSPPPPLHSLTPDPCWYHFMWYYTPPSLGSCAEQTVLSHCSSPDRLALSYLKFSYFLNDFFMWTIFKTLYWICYNIALFFFIFWGFLLLLF